MSHVCTIHFGGYEWLQMLMPSKVMQRLISCTQMEHAKRLTGHKVGIPAMSK